MNLFIYSDESGVFDHKHESFFVFGGLILINKENKEAAARKYTAIEQSINMNKKYAGELKANILKPKEKRRLFSALGDYCKFGIVINLNTVNKNIFNEKKSKQRYLDYAYKVGVKNTLLKLSQSKQINFSEINNLYFFCDEHTTATDGRYELREGLEQEFKFGTFNSNYCKFFPPILPDMKSLELKYVNSEKQTLVRAADIVANKIYYHMRTQTISNITSKIIIHFLP